MARIPGTFDFSANLEVNKLGPLDARLTVESKSELTGLPFAYIGMVVSVTSDTTPANNGVYVLNDTNSTDVNNWTLLTEGASLPTGGTTGQVLSKTDATDYNVEWTDAIEGAKGEPGNDGATGPQGLTGATGPQGLTGNDGAKGEPGNDGAAGSDGAKGEPGNDGATGPTGPIGATGPQGLTGNDGAKGEPGNDGAKGEPGNDGAKGEPGNDGAKGETGAGVPIGGTTGQSLVKTSDTDYDTEWTTVVSGGATATYIARAEFDNTQTLKGAYFLDPSGTGKYLTSGVTAGTPSGTSITFAFSNEIAPPSSILAFAANSQTNEYIITHLNGGGDDISHKIVGLNFGPYTSQLGEVNQVDADLFTSFGSYEFSLDLAKANFDWNRIGFPQAKEAHIYLVFRF